MLFGEDLGRRHDRALVAALHSGEERHERDDGLARPDFTLEEPVHRMRRRHVAADLVNRSLLRPRQLVGKRSHEPVHEGTLGLVRDSGRLLDLAALAQGKCHLESEQLVEHEAFAGRSHLDEIFWEVNRFQRRGPVEQIQPVEQALGEHLSNRL